MKTETLFNLIGDINDEWLTETEKAIKYSTAYFITKVAVIAAAACAIIGAGIYLSIKHKNKH